MRTAHATTSRIAPPASCRASNRFLFRSSSGTSQSRSSSTPSRVRDSATCRASTEVHSSRVQADRTASGDKTSNTRSLSFNPSSIFATKLSPCSTSTSQSQGSMLFARSSVASFSTKSLSLVLCERKSFMNLSVPESGKSARHTAPPRALLHRGFPAIREWWLVYPPLWPVAICRTKSGRRVLRGVWLRQAASRAEPSPPRHWGAPQAARPSPACAMLCHVARRAPSSAASRSPRFPASSRTAALHRLPHPARGQARQPVVHAPPVLLKRSFGHLHPPGARHGAQHLYEPVAIQRVVREHFAVQPAGGFASG